MTETNPNFHLEEQNDLLRQQLAVCTALLESKDTQMLLVLEKFETVNEKLESLLGAGTSNSKRSSTGCSAFATDGESSDSSLPVESSEDEKDSRPSSSRDYVIESRNKEEYWRGTKNDQFILSMANEKPILESASQYFIEMYKLRSVFLFFSFFE
jgi:hypothetical protein